MSERPVICFYHKQCIDGTASAAVVLRKYPEAQTFPLGFDTVEADLASALPEITPESLIIYVDNAMRLEQIALLGNEILVIDHHISERERVEEIARDNNKVTFIFNLDESGATLAWKHFFPDEEIPTLLSYVRDIDIWQNELLPESQWSHLFLSQYRDKPEEFKELIFGDLEKYLEIGQVLAGAVEREVDKSLKLEPVKLKIKAWEVLAYNVTSHQSKAGHLLSEKNGAVVLLYTISGDMVRCSLRSIEGQSPTALDVASALDGGGHVHSSGAGVRRDHFFSLIMD
jgi:uncharacterized protein